MPAIDHFASTTPGLIGQIVGGEAVIPHDVDEQAFVCRALWVGAPGNISLLMLDDTTIILVAVAVGLYPVRAKRVNATDTTAASMVFLK